jgi:hypothetical protein
VTRTVFAELVGIAAGNPGWPATLMVACGIVAALASLLAAHRIVRLEPSEILRRT